MSVPATALEELKPTFSSLREIPKKYSLQLPHNSSQGFMSFVFHNTAEFHNSAQKSDKYSEVKDSVELRE